MKSLEEKVDALTQSLETVVSALNERGHAEPSGAAPKADPRLVDDYRLIDLPQSVEKYDFSYCEERAGSRVSQIVEMKTRSLYVKKNSATAGALMTVMFENGKQKLVKGLFHLAGFEAKPKTTGSLAKPAPMASATASCEDATAALASFNIERMAAHTPALQSFYDFARSKGAAYCLDLLKPLLAVSPFAVDASVGTKISHMRDLLAKHIAPEVTKLAPGSPAEEQIQPAVENFLPGSIEVYRADSELRGIYPTYGSYRAFIAATSGPVVAQRIRLEREANHPRFVDGAWVLGKVGAFETEWLNDPKLQAEFPSAKGYAAYRRRMG